MIVLELGTFVHVRDLAAASPDEVCGALVGTGDRVLAAWPLANRSAEPAARFFIPAHDVLRVEREAEAQGLRLLGFYHSHPQGAAVPSPHDLTLAVPGYTYLIVARDGAARAWRLRADRSDFDEVGIETWS